MIGFAGLGHLGITSSVVAAARGFEVTAFDPDPAVVDMLRANRLPIVEPGLAELLGTCASPIRFTAAASDLASCDVVFIVLDVFTDASGVSDLQPIRRLSDQVMAEVGRTSVVVVSSQVPPGFTRSLVERRPSPGRRPKAFYQVETLVLGQAVERASKPERLVIGCANPDEELPASYRSFLESFGCPVLRMRYESAELAKIAINLMLASSIATTNVLAEVCERIGADWEEIVPALRLDRRIGPNAYLAPGLGLSGGKLERDLATVEALAADQGFDPALFRAWRAGSARSRDWVLRILEAEGLTARADSVLAVWGLAYKPGTDSTMNSPALALIDALAGRELRVHDPAASVDLSHIDRLTRVAHPLTAADGADALTIMTAWTEYGHVDLADVRRRMRGRLIVDPFGITDGQRAADLGFSRFRLGATPGRISSPC